MADSRGPFRSSGWAEVPLVCKFRLRVWSDAPRQTCTICDEIQTETEVKIMQMPSEFRNCKSHSLYRIPFSGFEVENCEFAIVAKTSLSSGCNQIEQFRTFQCISPIIN